MQRVVVIDYGMGNVRSVQKALQHVAVNADILISANPDDVDNADRVVFPGQGAMPDCMRNLREYGLERAVREAAASKPFFGICVGMQMLFDHSEEGDTAGLGIFPGRVKRIRPADPQYKVPHMGWNQVQQTHAHALWQDIQQAERFYFVHSFYCEPSAPQVVTGEVEYAHSFTAAVGRDNIFATQFHPEKSQHAGLQLYRNFLHWSP